MIIRFASRTGIAAALSVVWQLSQGCGDDVIERVVVSPSIETDAMASGGSVPNDGGTPDAHGPPCEGDSCDGRAICGNGEREAREQCDDGNRRPGDGCDWRCRIERCGNGRLDRGEECDDDNLSSKDGCSAECTIETTAPACGDGEHAEPDEECDDGNLVSGDGCDEQCRIERCGNGRLEAGEECDPPSAGRCDLACKRLLAHCGDGSIQENEGEQCDDGNDVRGDGCHGCRLECGDGVVNRGIGEECEPMFVLEGRCDPATCKRLPACGNGEVEPEAGEECDPSDGVACVHCKLVDLPETDAGTDAGAEDGPVCVPSEQPVTHIENGTFDADTSGWTPRTRIELEHAEDAGAEAQGSLLMRFRAAEGGTNNEVSGAYQCVSVRGNAEYVVGVRYQIPSGVAAMVAPLLIVWLHDAADCSDTGVPVHGLGLSNVRGGFVPYQRAIQTSASTRAMFIQLSVAKPRNVEGTVVWDDVALEELASAPLCGNCVIDDEEGETCDDGNRLAGDGCGPTCRTEGCGDGAIDPPESCDDGNQAFGGDEDACSPACRLKDACDACVGSACRAELEPCLNLSGEALAGPAAGTARAALCDELRACVHATGCNGDTAIAAGEGFGGSGRFLEHCYCGSAGQDCFEGAANGSCRAEVEAALETTDPVEILGRMGGADPDYPVFAALDELLACERAQCAASCGNEPDCGDGVIQDRAREFAESLVFRIGGSLSPCLDELTASGVGCSFEECDDGNREDGDGCDANCFEEVCGNHLQQAGEACDDGNRMPGDGCDANCMAEFECGDGNAEAPFEECDPPDDGRVCTQAEYEADPSQCGCDQRCLSKVCGNGLLQEGEQCDPPGPVCSDTCELLEDTCTSCIRRIDWTTPCAGRNWLEGESSFPGLDRGCLNDEPCFALWNCYRTTLCHLTQLSDCYCGAGVSANACEDPSHVPTGPCKDETLRAFEAQFQAAPTGNVEVLDRHSDFGVSPSGFASLFAASDLATNCLLPDSAATGGTLATRQLLLAMGVSESEAEACVNACFP